MSLKQLCVLLFLIIVEGVFGVDADEVKSVSVLEGDSVTLNTDLTELHTDDHILWMFGPQETLIAEIIKRYNSSSIYDDSETGRFRDRLKLDSQTGSLTITNSGLYTLQIRSNRGTSYKRFNVNVYVHLPVPVIISYCSSLERSSVSKCVLLCSVMNMAHVSLSWYKGNSLLSSISVSDLNIRLSLPLEVEYQDTNTYTCVINNPITNQTQHLHISDVCHKCSTMCTGLDHTYLVIIIAVMGFLLITAAGLVCFLKYRIVAVKRKHMSTIRMNDCYNAA